MWNWNGNTQLYFRYNIKKVNLITFYLPSEIKGHSPRINSLCFFVLNYVGESFFFFLKHVHTWAHAHTHTHAQSNRLARMKQGYTFTFARKWKVDWAGFSWKISNCFRKQSALSAENVGNGVVQMRAFLDCPKYL